MTKRKPTWTAAKNMHAHEPLKIKSSTEAAKFVMWVFCVLGVKSHQAIQDPCQEQLALEVI